MSSVELTPSQEMILRALIDLSVEIVAAVKGEEIARKVDRDPGTIRNQMQSLKALQLVEGVPGPKGGYKPTASAYEILETQRIDTPAEIPIRRKDAEEINAVVENIALTSVHHPELCEAEITVEQSINEIEEGDSITVGPTPLTGLLVEGCIDEKDAISNILIVNIDSLRVLSNRDH